MRRSPSVAFVAMNVLIADNDRAVSGLLGEVLQQAGVAVRFAYDGDEAARMARDDDVALLVCDLDMPKASGLEVLEGLGELESPPAAMVVSGYVDQRVEARLSALPFVREVLRKPFDLLAFSTRVRCLLDAAAPAADEPAGLFGPPGGEVCGESPVAGEAAAAGGAAAQADVGGGEDAAEDPLLPVRDAGAAGI